MAQISIITPTYNAERFIDRTIKSVITQTFTDWELIVIDNKSTDATLNIVRKYCDSDSRIVLIEQTQNSGGPSLSRTIGVQNSNSELVAFLDADDIYYPNYLAHRVYLFSKNPYLEIVRGASFTCDYNTRKIINYESIIPLNFVIKKSRVVQAEYFKKEQEYVDEVGMLGRLHISKNSTSYLYLSEPMTIYMRHDNQHSLFSPQKATSFISRMDSLLADNPDSDLEAYCYARKGNFYMFLGDITKARQSFKKSLIVKFNLFSLVLFYLTFLGTKMYVRIEYIFRFIQRQVFWKLKVLYFKVKYYRSYNEAKKIIYEK